MGPEVQPGRATSADRGGGDSTDTETSERHRLEDLRAAVMVAWPHNRLWEDRASLTRLDDKPDLYRYLRPARLWVVGDCPYGGHSRWRAGAPG